MIMANRRKLTKEIATSIRHLYKDLEYTAPKLSYIFNVSTSVVYNILRNITYGDADYNPSEVPDTPLLKHYNKYVKNHYLYHDMKYDECFKTIDGFPHYKICVDGTIFSDVGFHYTKVKTHIQNNGYMVVELWNNNTYINKTLHTLIAKYFLTNNENLPCVLHKNDDKLDNTLENLYFGTQKDNVNDRIKNGRHIHRIPEITKEEIKKTINLIPSITNIELMKRFGITIQSVRKIRNEYENQQN